MTKAENYLSNRLSMLSDEKIIITTKINNLDIEIEEINEKIREISNDMDDTFEIFSPRVKKNDFIRDEIQKLKNNREELSRNKEKLCEQTKMVDEDIKIIKDALSEKLLAVNSEKNSQIEDYSNSNSEIQSESEEPDSNLNISNNIKQQDLDNVDKMYTKNTLGIHILKYQENERQRIARDLHDSTVQVLANLVHRCEICSKVMDVDSVRAKLEIEVIEKTLKDSISDMRNIIYNLRPMIFDDLGFEATLTKVVNKFNTSSDFNITLEMEGESVNLEPVVAITIIRIIEESCNNSIKHSNGSEIKIYIKNENKVLHIEVSDNGDGYVIDEILKPEENNNKGFGVSMMKERVALLSGEIAIDSKINEGTKITIDIPIM